MSMRPWIVAVAGLSAALVLGLREVEADSPRDSSGIAAHGKQLFVAIGCYQCHGTQGQGGSSAGPRLAPNPIPFPAFALQLRTPRERMPVYTATVLSDGDLADLYAYLQSIPQEKTLDQIPLLRNLQGKPAGR
jgi:mono/diheme cytochrome c family protein